MIFHGLYCVLALLCWSQLVATESREQHKQPTPLKTCGDQPMVEMAQGPICGTHCPDGPREVCGKKIDFITTRKYRAFCGIPFAKPPVGQLRFKSPVPGEPWSDHRDGSWMPPMCPQMDMLAAFSGNISYGGQEDCLFLNVYIPEISVPEKGFPVMVWAHGGGFVMGGVQEYFADKLMTRDVVLVSIQYRLGVLGWFSTDDNVAPGNLALKDLELSLRWVQDNIASFGGDPSKVTIFGESAGSALVDLTLTNPQAKGLFSRAIMQSGTSLIAIQEQFDHRMTAFKIATKLGCNNDVEYNSEELLKCLQEIPDPFSFIDVSGAFVEWGNAPQAFSPRLGGASIPGLPDELLRDGKYNMVDLMMGICQHEGGLFTKGWFMNPNAFKDIAANFSSVAHHAMNMHKDRNSVIRQMFQYYLGGIREYKLEDADLLTTMLGDYFFDMPHDYSIELHSRDSLYGKNVYAYEFKHKGHDTFVHNMNPDIGPDYVNHGDELMSIFKLFPDYINETNSEANKKLENIMLDLWTNFATHGNPTPDRSLGFTWSPVTLKSTDHLTLKPEPYMEADTRCQRRKFFSSLNITVNQVLFPDRIGQGQNWMPWRVEDQRMC